MCHHGAYFLQKSELPLFAQIKSASGREYLSLVELAFIVYEVDKIKGHRRNRCESHELGK